MLLHADVDPRRKIDAHQGVNGLRRRVEDVDQSLVCTHLEVLPRVLVLMRGPDDAVHVLLSRQRHRTNHAGAGTGDRFHDLARRGVNSLVAVGLEPDADLLSRHASPTSLLLGSPRMSRWYAAAVHLSVVHRSPRSGVSPARTLSRGRNRRDRGGDRMRPLGRWSYAPRQAAQKGAVPAQGNPNSMP